MTAWDHQLSCNNVLTKRTDVAPWRDRGPDPDHHWLADRGGDLPVLIQGFSVLNWDYRIRPIRKRVACVHIERLHILVPTDP